MPKTLLDLQREKREEITRDATAAIELAATEERTRVQGSAN